MWLVAFGYGMGALVGQVDLGGTRVPYILFLASGSICMSAMNAASFEALYSAFSRMHVQKTWDGIMNAPTVYASSTRVARRGWAGHWSMNIGRTSSTALVSGSQSETMRTGAGSCSRGKNTPERNIIGVRNSVK